MVTVSPTEGEAPERGVGAGLSRLQAVVLLLCLGLYMVDGADVLVVSYAAPSIGKLWRLTPGVLGIVFSAGLAGMGLGALILGPVADLIGRRKLILGAVALVAVTMGASAFAPDFQTLVALRVAVGLGVGALLAATTAMADEFAPERNRTLAVAAATAGYPLGAVLSGVAATFILPAFGWRALFAGAALFSVVLLPLILAFMPESLAFLLTRRTPEALAAVNRSRARMGLTALADFPPAGAAPSRPSLRALLGGEQGAATLMLWVAFFALFATLYFLTSWIPKIVLDAGLPQSAATAAGALFNLGAFIGIMVLAVLARAGRLPLIICVYMLLAAAGMVLVGFHHGTAPMLLTGVFAIGFLVQGGFNGLYVVAARLYPTSVRTTGVGSALGLGRLGAVIGPLIGGVVIGSGASISLTFSVFAAPLLLAALMLLPLSGRADAG